MAIVPEDEFVGKIAPADAEYPYGKARNIVSAGDGTGTPWKANLVNDIWGFLQGLLVQGGVTPSGNPDTAIESDYVDAIKNIITKKVKMISDFGDVEGDASEAFINACASGEKVIIDGNGKIYNIQGTFQVKSGTELVFQNNPIINLHMDGDLENRNFYFYPTEDEEETIQAHAWGHATFNVTAENAQGDGSILTVFNLGRYCYGDGVDAKRVAHCSVRGKFIINGSAEDGAVPKIAMCWGWCEDIVIEGFETNGDMAFDFGCHWGQNITLEQRNAGVLPTKTWHADRIIFRNIKSGTTWPNSNAFTTSAVGKILFENCDSVFTPESFNLFVGDLGYTYAQNLINKYPDIHIKNGRLYKIKNYGVSGDQQTNPVGLFKDAPLWTSADAKNGGRLIIEGMTIIMDEDDASITAIAITAMSEVILRDFAVFSKNDTATAFAIQLYGVNYALIEGKCDSQSGILLRNCGKVDISKLDNQRVSLAPDDVNVGVAIATSEQTNVLTVGATTLGATQITINGCEYVCGAGGYIKVTILGTTYEIRLLSSTFPYLGQETTDVLELNEQTIDIEPCPVAIPDGTTITLGHTVRELILRDSKIEGFSYGVRQTSVGNSKAKRIVMDNITILKGGVYDIAIENCEDLNILNSYLDEGGNRTTTDNKNSIDIGAGVESYVIDNVRFGKNCNKMRYLISNNDAATGGIIDNCHFESLNTAAANAACIFRNMSNVKIGNNNFFATGLTKVYNNLFLPFTPVFYGSVTAGTPTGTFTGILKRIGEMNTLFVRANFTGLGGMAGNLMMSGLPSVVNPNAHSRGGLIVGYITGKATATDILGGYCGENTQTIIFSKLNANNANWTIADMTSTMGFYFTVSYLSKE